MLLTSLERCAHFVLGATLLKRLSGLKAKITLFIILNVVTVLFLFSYLDYRLSKKDQIDFYLDRNLYIAKQIDKMGIADQLKDKTKFPPSGGFSGTLLISGDADMAIQSKPELLSIPGVEVIGPLPGDMAFTVVYAAGVQSGAAQPDAAKAFVNFLKSPEAQAVFKAKGYDPA